MIPRYIYAMERHLSSMRWPAVIWILTALASWGLFFFSLPGYYAWFYAEPLRLGFTGTQMFYSVIAGSASLLCALISLGLGTFLYLRKAADRGALFVSYFLLLYGALMSGPVEMVEFWISGQSLVFSSRVQSVFFVLPFYLLFLTFPNGIITPRAFRWLFLFIIPIIPMMVILKPSEINSINTLRSQVVFLYIGVLLFLALGAQVYRYFWVSTPVERQQTKIVLYGIGLQTLMLLISGAIYVRLPAEAYGYVYPEIGPVSLIWWLGLAILPVSITLAVYRSHLWEIDVVIRRTLLYGFLSLALAVVYFGSVILLQAGFRAMIGHESQLAVILSTLAIASLFNPLRGVLQAAIDRRFFRGKYNSEQALLRFQNSLREHVNLEQVEGELTSIVKSTVQPEWVTLWMRRTE